ncbi:EKC/KEOPS complex subunit bud32 [Diplonema papillatum]|nr:EKC/KEOPS complex subunit bud32 [Diplonema papillatum]
MTAVAVDNLLFSGAEARVYEGEFFGKRAVFKERFAKGYRHPDMDLAIRSRRTVAEAKALAKCRKCGIRTPVVYSVDLTTMTIAMSLIEGKTLRETLGASADGAFKSQLAGKVGEVLAALHNAELVHGDLTTSNLLLSNTNEVYLIDFGLTTASALPEDYAVDLYVLERAIQSTHADETAFAPTLLATYKKKASKGAQTLERLQKVRSRGRKRSMVG